MGLLEDLDYAVKPANRLQMTLQRAAARPWISSTLQKTLYPLDKTLHRSSGGRHTVSGMITGIPVIMLTTTGAKTGKARSIPLIGIPMEDRLVVIGSNYGTKATPDWVHNLEANPAAEVTYRDPSRRRGGPTRHRPKDRPSVRIGGSRVCRIPLLSGSGCRTGDQSFCPRSGDVTAHRGTQLRCFG